MSESAMHQNPVFRSAIIAALALLLLVMLWESDEPSGPEGPRTGTSPEADGFVENGSFLTYDETGALSIRFKSSRIEQYDAEQRVVMTGPEAELFRRNTPDESPWTIRSDSGVFLQDADEVLLTGNVLVEQTSNAGTPIATLETDSLTLNNATRVISTEQPVTLLHPMGRTTAKGMVARIDDRILELKNDVEGTYDLRRR